MNNIFDGVVQTVFEPNIEHVLIMVVFITVLVTKSALQTDFGHTWSWYVSCDHKTRKADEVELEKQ